MKADLAVNGRLEEAVAFAYKHNQNNETGSSYCAKRREAIAKEYQESVKNGTLACVWDKKCLAGLISWYEDSEKMTVDCGILIDPAAGSYPAIAKLLLSQVKRSCGEGRTYQFFFPRENTVCRNFLEQAGAERGVHEYLLILRKGTQRLNGGSRMGCPKPLGKESDGQLEKLHDEIFPGIYISGAELVSDRNGNHAVYGIIEEGRLIAYSVLRIDSSTDGTAEIVGVEAGYRHKGYGRTVLSYLIERAFEDYGMDKIRLVVDGDNENAIRLYRDLGFTEEGENCFYSLKL